MTSLGELEGREFPGAAAFTVGREHVREFARAVGASGAAHVDVEAARAAGHTDLVAPATYAAAVAQREEWALWSAPDVEIDFHRVVHGEERIELARPLIAGDVLTSVLTVERVREVRGNTMVTTRSDLMDADEKVASVWSMIIVRGGEEQA